VFDNGRLYELRVSAVGYNVFSMPNIAAGADVFLDLFYRIAIPAGVTNIRISNAGWVDTTVWYAYDMQSDVITLMKTNTAATLRFDYNGLSHVVPFTLNGTNPFDDLTIFKKIIY